MKIFVSWSGELSKKIAETLKKWLPCFIQATEVFFSPEDIEKGENWDSKISKELSECKYGIICLTQENVTAPWINFEAGAIAKTLDSRVAGLMINLNPSEIKGPLSRYQATKLEKEDCYRLIQGINQQCETPIKDEVLKTSFDGLWDNMESEMKGIISTYKKPIQSQKKEGGNNNQAIEEMLLLLRKQNALLSSPEQLLPIEYLAYIQDIFAKNAHSHFEIGEDLCREVLRFLQKVISIAEMDPAIRRSLMIFEMEDLMLMVGKYAKKSNNRDMQNRYRDLRFHFKRLFESYDSIQEKIEG